MCFILYQQFVTAFFVLNLLMFNTNVYLFEFIFDKHLILLRYIDVLAESYI
jgi:hypothetical protein